MMRHESGPGLKTLGTQRWWGGAYCGICGTRKVEGSSPLIPQAVRWWDADDGWKMGVLCQGCGEEAAVRGPRKGDYALAEREQQASRIDLTASLGDLDSTYSDQMP